MSYENEITTNAGKFFWKEVEKNLGTKAWSTFGKAIVAIENEMREHIAKEIEQIDIGSASQLNGLGMRMIAAKVVGEKK